MLENLAPQTIQICLLAVGVVIVILLAALLLIRILRGSVFGMVNLLLRAITEPKDEPRHTAAPPAPEQALPDLRERAQELDFNATVAKYRQEQGTETPAAAPSTPPAPNRPFLNFRRRR